MLLVSSLLRIKLFLSYFKEAIKKKISRKFKNERYRHPKNPSLCEERRRKAIKTGGSARSCRGLPSYLPVVPAGSTNENVIGKNWKMTLNYTVQQWAIKKSWIKPSNFLLSELLILLITMIQSILTCVVNYYYFLLKPKKIIYFRLQAD